MSAVAAPLPPPPGDPQAAAPQTRTLLITDMVDSTGTVERLGDRAAADLFRGHDRLVLELQRRWRGRLIDRSDGLLLLFERAIDGLGFALDYQRGLHDMGKARGLDLKARAGIHVGEVLTWHNEAEAVEVGAKPLEVEGLAKPMAGRLLGIARPGQILLSGTAESLARRATTELGDRGGQLLWKAHGRWRLKGVENPIDVWEAGEPGFAPLRRPIPDGKSRRDVPKWRQPLALAAQLFLVASLGLLTWFFTRPQPAIAFSERDWVVVADMRNLTGQPVLDDSLQQAFRISLEQSRHVNVLSDLKARDTLARMQRGATTALDREVASEIALRDGARAVILPTVAEVGGRVRVSAEVIDPHSQTTVYSEFADGDGLDSVLASVDDVTAALRARLGEEVKAIQRDSEPLPAVTTSNLDALRAYALAQEAFAKNDYPKALRLYQRATQLDPKFGLAWQGVAKAHYGLLEMPQANDALLKAQSLRDHMPPKDAMYVDGWVAELTAPKQALSLWQELADLYPDYERAQANVAIRLLRANRFKDALPYAERAAHPKSSIIAAGHDLLGRARLGSGDEKGAFEAFRIAHGHGAADAKLRQAEALAAQRRFAQARQMLEGMGADDYRRSSALAHFAADQSSWDRAVEHLDEAITLISKGGRDVPSKAALEFARAVALEQAGQSDKSFDALKSLAERTQVALGASTLADAQDQVGILLAIALEAHRAGQHDYARELTRSIRAQGWPERLPDIDSHLVLVRSEELIAEGRAGEAIKLLQAELKRGSARFQAWRTLARAHAAEGNEKQAQRVALEAEANRGFAYAELGCYRCQMIVNLVPARQAPGVASR